mgnify:CR=1 FL=1
MFWRLSVSVALRSIAKKAMDRKTGARGLRTIMEQILLDIMYDLPDQPTSNKYEITEDIVEGRAKLFKLPEPLEHETKTKSA